MVGEMVFIHLFLSLMSALIKGINQGHVKGTILCFRNLDFYFRHREISSPASQKSKDLDKVLLLLQDLGDMSLESSDLGSQLSQ